MLGRQKFSEPPLARFQRLASHLRLLVGGGSGKLLESFTMSFMAIEDAGHPDLDSNTKQAKAGRSRQVKMDRAKFQLRPRISRPQQKIDTTVSDPPDIVDVSTLSVSNVRLRYEGHRRLSDEEAESALELFKISLGNGAVVNIADEEARAAAQREVHLGDRLIAVRLLKCRWLGGKVRVGCKVLTSREVRARATADKTSEVVHPIDALPEVHEMGTLVPISTGENNVATEPPDQAATKVPTFDLAASEAVIRANLGKLAIVGREFARIRESGQVKNWAKWCRENWHKSKRAVDYLISESEVWQRLNLPDDFPVTRLRPLVSLTPAQQIQAWEKANQYAMKSEGQPTAKSISMAAQAVAGKPSENPTPEWSLAQAQHDFEVSVIAAARRAIVGADDAQAKLFNEELRLLMDNIKELFPGGAPLTTV